MGNMMNRFNSIERMGRVRVTSMHGGSNHALPGHRTAGVSRGVRAPDDASVGRAGILSSTPGHAGKQGKNES